jgi:predicted ATPase/DNA-binding SARP family transcriptional activator/uncharacterized protein HemY
MPATEMAPAPLAITLFGPMQVQVHGRPLPALRSHKHLWLLALLTLRPNRPVEREWLAGTMWPEVEQSNAFDNLRPVLSELRKALGDQSQRLQSPDRFTLMLDLTHAEVDLLRFDAAIHSGTLSELEQAVGLYRGPLLEGCREEWALPERASREQVYLQALQTLGEASLTGGEYDAAAGYYQQAVRMDPWREAERRGWMEALARSGDINAALQVYREFVTFLKDDPKAIPDAQTTALYQRLRAEVRQRAGTHAVVAAEVVAVSVVKGYLPHSITDLVGREDERLEVALQLRRSRLVTLTGMGGIGKTRLAREVAGEVVGEYADGVWLVALEALSEGRLVIQQIASVLELQEERGRIPLQQVIEHLRRKRLLLVLDNCEHLLEASGLAITHLLGECAEVRILATSREALGITGETVWAVPALSVPAHLPVRPSTLVRVVMGYESVQLFVERAQAVQQSFALSGSNARAVAQVCQQLEGIPLAIELAAARVKAMTVEQITSRLEDYLSLLTGGSRAAQSRQQTLRATLDWSYALLSEAERSLLRRLSVFVGGWTLEAAEQVCGDFGLPILDFGLKVDSLDSSRSGQEPIAIQNPKSKIQNGEVFDLLTSLVDKSLVLFEARGPGTGRYRLLEMVRQYAAESLLASGEAEQVKGRHQGWYLTFAEQSEPALKTGEQLLWLTRLEIEHDNLRSALAWSLKSVGESPLASPTALLFCSALQNFWDIHGHLAEGRAWCEKALQANATQERTHARARALNGAGKLAIAQGDYVAAQAQLEESLAIQREIGDLQGMAASLNALGNVAIAQGDYVAAQAQLEESLAIRREIGDRWGITISLHNLGNVAYVQGDYVAAQAHFEESLAITREIGDRRSMAVALHFLGNVAIAQGDYVAAQAHFEESLAIRREIGDRWGIGASLIGLGNVAHAQGDYATAQAHFEESLVITREIGDRQGIAVSLHNLGNVAAAQGDYATAQTHFEESLAIRSELGQRWGIASSLNALGNAAKERDEYTIARALHKESLAIRREIGDQIGMVFSLESFAALIASETTLATTAVATAEVSAEIGAGLRRAARMWGAARAGRDHLGAPLSLREQVAYDQQVAQARSALGPEAFATAQEEGRAMTLEQAVAYALEPESISPSHSSPAA